MRTIETLTRICPPSICGEKHEAEAQAVPNTARSFATDVGTVYLHLVLPEPYVDRLPQIDDAWGNFGRDAGAEEAVQRSATGEIEPCGRNTCRFADLIDDDTRPTLYLSHTLLPHVPYVYLPSGRRYAVDARLLRGLDNGHWLEPWPAVQGHQRYLLQTGYTDRSLGVILRRLRETGVYDRALVIVTADHGVGFRDQRRLPTPQNLDEIAFVPLFVKLPGQRAGRIDDGLARNIDVVPTVARVLGLTLPWRADGRTLVGRRLARDGTITVLKQDRSRVSRPSSRRCVRAAHARSRSRSRRSGPGRSSARTGSARTRSSSDASSRRSRCSRRAPRASSSTAGRCSTRSTARPASCPRSSKGDCYPRAPAPISRSR